MVMTVLSLRALFRSYLGYSAPASPFAPPIRKKKRKIKKNSAAGVTYCTTFAFLDFGRRKISAFVPRCAGSQETS
jgi:hypothetical protein